MLIINNIIIFLLKKNGGESIQPTNTKGRARRKAGSFALYMKENYSQVKDFLNKERLKALSEKYKSEKSK